MATKRKLSKQLPRTRVRDVLERRSEQQRARWSFRLPGAEQLARELGTSLRTLRSALDRMDDERCWSSRHGPVPTDDDCPTRGPADGFPLVSDPSQEPYGKYGRLLQQVRRRATKMERERLQLGSGEQVLVTERVRYRGGVPFLYEKACLAMSRLARTDLGDVGNYCLTDLARQCGARLGRGRDHMSVARAGQMVAEQLGVEEHTWLIRIERTVYMPDGLPVEWQVGFC